MALLGSKVKPSHGLSVILGHTKALPVVGAEIELRFGVALLGGDAMLARGFGLVLLARTVLVVPRRLS
jgi:hypothetical protein